MRRVMAGNPAVLAVESGISRTFERPGQKALGYFVLHIGGARYGVLDPEATLLACSVDAVKRRMSERGRHTGPFASEPAGERIAAAAHEALYSENQKDAYWGMPTDRFVALLHTNNLIWAPDGDEAFDDGSFVLQFDIDDRVRLIAYKSKGAGHVDSSTLRDVWLQSDLYYGTLQQWLADFETSLGTK